MSAGPSNPPKNKTGQKPNKNSQNKNDGDELEQTAGDSG